MQNGARGHGRCDRAIGNTVSIPSIRHSRLLANILFSCDYLPKRYPSMFMRTPVGINNVVTNEEFNIVQRPLAEEPMKTIGRLIQDDIAIMTEGTDGQSYLKSGSIILPGFWKLEEKFNMNLSEIRKLSLTIWWFCKVR